MSGSDARLVADIEKLLKRKIEIETLAYDAQPTSSASSSSYARSGSDHSRRSEQGTGSSDHRTARPSSSSSGSGSNGRPERASSYGEHSNRRDRGGFRPAVPSRDPFFEKPYEASADSEAAHWEAAGRTAIGRVVSPNIKARRKVAALFRPGPETDSTVPSA